ncbi:AmmeMemoRadiSam system protein B [archaeon]|jgi:MEMO1 family protein|nr:AmmeMemoRadiSam system protein B [archaeon]
MRKSVFDGQYYNSDFSELDSQISDLFFSDMGPGDLPITRSETRSYGVIVPHSKYSLSGSCASWAYKKLAEGSFPDVYVIIGTNHSGYGNFVSTEGWETPFGRVNVDEGLSKLLLAQLPFLHEGNIAHKREHSLEVQLPFLQFISKDRLRDLKILPIMLGSENSYEKLRDLGRAIGDSERNVCVIAVSNFTQYGSNYDYTPSVLDNGTEVKMFDKKAISFITNLDSKGFFECVKDNKMNFSGVGPIVCAIEAAKLLGSKQSNLLRYYTSKEINGIQDNFIGYGAISFE